MKKIMTTEVIGMGDKSVIEHHDDKIVMQANKITLHSPVGAHVTFERSRKRGSGK